MNITDSLIDEANKVQIAAVAEVEKYSPTPLAEAYHSWLRGSPVRSICLPTLDFSTECPGGTATWNWYWIDREFFQAMFAWLRDNLPAGATIKLQADGRLQVLFPGFSVTARIPAGVHIGELADAIREFENPILLPRPRPEVVDVEFEA